MERAAHWLTTKASVFSIQFTDGILFYSRIFIINVHAAMAQANNL